MTIKKITIASLPDIVTVDEAAAVLRVSRPTIVRLIRNGQLAAIQIGKQYRIEKTSITDQIYRTSPSSDCCNPQ